MGPLPSKRPWSIVCMGPSLNKGPRSVAFIGPLLKGPQSIAYMGPSLKQKTMIYNLHGTIAKKGIAIYSLQSKRDALQSKGRSKFTKVGIVGLFWQSVAKFCISNKESTSTPFEVLRQGRIAEISKASLQWHTMQSLNFFLL
jgi:hypothetical protein